MRTIELVELIVKTQQTHLFKRRLGFPGECDVQPLTGTHHPGWAALDVETAQTIVRVLGTLSEPNKEKFARLSPIHAAEMAWQLA